MHTPGAWLAAILPVALAAMLAAVGWSYRNLKSQLSTLNDSIQRFHTRVTIIETMQAAQPWTRVETISQNQAVMASEMEAHQRWHERNDPGPHR